jgi:hypothetical protein
VDVALVGVREPRFVEMNNEISESIIVRIGDWQAFALRSCQELVVGSDKHSRRKLCGQEDAVQIESRSQLHGVIAPKPVPSCEVDGPPNETTADLDHHILMLKVVRKVLQNPGMFC